MCTCRALTPVAGFLVILAAAVPAGAQLQGDPIPTSNDAAQPPAAPRRIAGLTEAERTAFFTSLCRCSMSGPGTTFGSVAGIEAANGRFGEQPAAEAPLKPWPEPEQARPCGAGSEIDSGARFSGVTGQVEVAKDCDLEQWRQANIETILFVQMHIRTLEESAAIIGFADRSTFFLKPETEVVVATPREKERKIDLLAGNVWVNIRKMTNGGTLDVEMAQAVCGVKGTIFVGSGNADASTVKVIEGSVEFTARANGQRVTLTRGQTATATAAGLDPVSTFDIEAEEANWRLLALERRPTRCSSKIFDTTGGDAGFIKDDAVFRPDGENLGLARHDVLYLLDGSAVGFFQNDTIYFSTGKQAGTYRQDNLYDNNGNRRGFISGNCNPALAGLVFFLTPPPTAASPPLLMAPSPTPQPGMWAYLVSALGPGGAVLPPDPTPWVFYGNGTVEAAGLWTGSWARNADGSVRVAITAQGMRDEFVVRFEDAGRVLKAYKDDVLYRQGVRRD